MAARANGTCQFQFSLNQVWGSKYRMLSQHLAVAEPDSSFWLQLQLTQWIVLGPTATAWWNNVHAA